MVRFEGAALRYPLPDGPTPAGPSPDGRRPDDVPGDPGSGAAPPPSPPRRWARALLPTPPALGPPALQDLTFALAPGSFTWLVGPSGAGKSSLLRLLALAARPTAGEVTVLGRPLSRTPRRALPALRRRIGVVHQDLRLLAHLSALDNVALPLRLAGRPEAELRADAAAVLRWVGLEGRLHALPPHLSGGERQRVAIARAVVARPALLVADEPTAGLDPGLARRLLALLAEMNRLGGTVVVATHDPGLIAAHPAPALRLERGRLVGHG